MNSNKPSPNLVYAFITNIAVNFYSFTKYLNFAVSNMLNEINVNTLSPAHNILAKNIISNYDGSDVYSKVFRFELRRATDYSDVSLWWFLSFAQTNVGRMT